jgi:hypothetical protein
MLKRALVFLLGFTTLVTAASAADAPKQPILILLYSRYYDHSHPHPLSERLFRTFRLLDQLRAQYPKQSITPLLQFSGAVSQILAEQDPTQHEVQQLRDAAKKGLIDIGYTGEEEPSYLYRPRADLIMADTEEKRWTAFEEAAEHFLNDFKDPVTGKPVDGLTGGLKHMQEVLGEASYISGLSVPVSGDSATIHALRKLNQTAVLTGVPVADLRRNIEGYGRSAELVAKTLSPDAATSPEVWWENGRLRISDVSLTDNKPHSTDEPPKALGEAFAKLDRTRPRVIKLEMATYTRYLAKRTDGTVKYDPMEWLYFHPDEPVMPMTLKALVDQGQVEDGYQNEEAVMKWLIEDFLPKNPGSRFISVHELKAMTQDTLHTEVTSDELGAAASDIVTRFKSLPMQCPDFAKAGDRYFSIAEAFGLLANALAGTKPVRSAQMYGPLVIPNAMGPAAGTLSAAAVVEAAARIAPRLQSDSWKLVPDDAVPNEIQVGELKVVPVQFLKLMAEAYLDPSRDHMIKLNSIAPLSSLTYNYPKNGLLLDQGNTWTLKPAPLRLGTGASAGY